ncbi:hypothetical protein V2I01_34195 [Micromonospora sp. BRA006-A]|nr:hypothetical protein [Micromonospora sp. BRA006-A]
MWVTDGPDWLRDSTTLVVRRISMNLETWDLLGRADRTRRRAAPRHRRAADRPGPNTTSRTSPRSARTGSPSSPTSRT